MNKLEANVSLIIITFFAAIQYVFLSGVPDTVSHFSFLCITNLIGFVIALALFFSELFRVDKKQVAQSLVMSLLLFGFNIFLLLGSSGVGATVSACVLSAYFVFIPVLSFILYRQKASFNSLIGIVIVLVGLFFMLGGEISGLLNTNILYLVIADVFFAMYILMADKYTQGSNPALLAMGQMLFNFLFALLFWMGESLIFKKPMLLPTAPAFWGSAIFIGFFIRGLYGIVQINAQRYVSPLSTSLIFSTEIVMTMVMSPVLASLFGGEPEVITGTKAIAAVVMVTGILIADTGVWDVIKKRAAKGRENLPRNLKLMLMAIVIYFVLDLPVQATNFLTFGPHIGIKNFLAPVLGMQFGLFGVLGSVIATCMTALIMGTPSNYVVMECASNIIIGLGIWLIYSRLSKSKKVHYKKTNDILFYVLVLSVLSVISGIISRLFVEGGDFDTILAAYVSMGLLVGIPVNIMAGGIFCFRPALLNSDDDDHDVMCSVTADPNSLNIVNDMLEEAALDKLIGRKRLFEVQSCIEELSIRIFASLPHTEIKLKADLGDSISVKLAYEGEKYNPLRIGKDEDKLDTISLTLIKHRALKASYKYIKNENNIHIVV